MSPFSALRRLQPLYCRHDFILYSRHNGNLWCGVHEFVSNSLLLLFLWALFFCRSFLYPSFVLVGSSRLTGFSCAHRETPSDDQVYNDKKLAVHYMRSRNFLLDIAALLPLDLLQLKFGTHPLLRFPRFFKVSVIVKNASLGQRSCTSTLRYVSYTSVILIPFFGVCVCILYMYRITMREYASVPRNR